MSTLAPITCETADLHLVELAYDEQVPADVRAHVDGCARCGAELRSLVSTRSAVARLPLEEPSPELDVKLAAALDAHFSPPAAVIPLRRSVLARWRAGVSMAAALAVVASGAWLVESRKEPLPAAAPASEGAPLVPASAPVLAAPSPALEKPAPPAPEQAELAVREKSVAREARAKDTTSLDASGARALGGGGAPPGSFAGPSEGAAVARGPAADSNLAAPPARVVVEAKQKAEAPALAASSVADAPADAVAAAPASPPPAAPAALSPAPAALRMAAPMAAPATAGRAGAESLDLEERAAEKPAAAARKAGPAAEGSAPVAMARGAEQLRSGAARAALDSFQVALDALDLTPAVRRDAMAGRVEAWLALGRLDEAEREARALVALFPERSALLARVLERRTPASAPASAPAKRP